MPSQINRPAYKRLIDENIEWLRKQPRTLEREHIIAIVEDSINWYYDPDETPTRPDPAWRVTLTKLPPLSTEFAKVISKDKFDTAREHKQGVTGFDGVRESDQHVVIAAALRDLRLTLRRPLMWAHTREAFVSRLATLLDLAGAPGTALYDVFRGPNGQVVGTSEVLDKDWVEIVRKRVIEILNSEQP